MQQAISIPVLRFRIWGYSSEEAAAEAWGGGGMDLVEMDLALVSLL